MGRFCGKKTGIKYNSKQSIFICLKHVWKGSLIFKFKKILIVLFSPLTVRRGRTCRRSVAQRVDLFVIIILEELVWPQNTVSQVCPKQQEFTPVIHDKVYIFSTLLFRDESHHNSFLGEIGIICGYQWKGKHKYVK